MGSMNNGDRYNKVQTCRGLKDRRIRLASETAIKLYDIHDRLGFDHPTMSVDWLLQQAQPAMDHLPPSKPWKTEDNLQSSSNHSSNDQSHKEQKLQRRTVRSEPSRKQRESEKERVERRTKARERARERTKQKLNIDLGLHNSTSSHYRDQNASSLTSKSSLPQDESDLNAFIQSPAREDTSTQNVCSSTDTLSPLLSDFGFPSPDYDNAFVFEDDFYL